MCVFFTLTITRVVQFSFGQQVAHAVGITVSTVVFTSVGSSVGPGEDMLLQYHAAHWTAFGFGIVALTLGIIFFKGVGVLGHSDGTPPRGSISETEKGKCESLD